MKNFVQGETVNWKIIFLIHCFFEKNKKNLKNFQKTIAKYGKVYYNLTEVVKSGTKWDISEVNFEC